MTKGLECEELQDAAAHAYLTELQQLLHEPAPKDSGLANAAIDTAHESALAMQQGLAFTLRSARHRRWSFARHLFPKLHAALAEPQKAALRQAFLASHAGSDIDWIRNGDAFLAAVHRLATRGDLPAATADLATHEWAMFEASLASEAPSFYTDVRRLQVNPTLQMRPYSFDPEVAQPLLAEAASEPVWFAYFLHPADRRVRWQRLDASTLAILRIVEEAIPLAAAAQAANLDEAAVQQQLEHHAKQGLLAAPV